MERIGMKGEEPNRKRRMGMEDKMNGMTLGCEIRLTTFRCWRIAMLMEGSK